MNILLITPDCPYPPEKSGGIHTIFNLMSANTTHKIDLLYYNEKDTSAESELEKLMLFSSIKYFPVKKRTGISGRVLSVLNKQPYAQYRFNFSSFPMCLDYDAVIYDQFSSEPLASKDLASRQICFVHDSMPRYFSRKKELTSNPLAKIYYELQSVFAQKAETSLISHIEKLIFVSEDDASYSAKLYHNSNRCRAISMGVDTIEGVESLKIGKSIVFTGVMNYAPNEDAALFYLKEIFPFVHERHPDVTLYLVGKNPTDQLVSACRDLDNVVLTGYVESVAAYILGATIYVSPLRFGTGVKNKVLEAMNCKAPMILSDASIEGIPECSPGVNCLMANSAQEWIEQTCRLLDDCNERQRLSRGVELTFGDHRSWSDAFDSLICN